MRAARFCSFLLSFRERFAAITPDNTTVIEMGLYQGVVDVMQYFWRHKRSNSLYGANAGGNLFGQFVDMTMPCHVIINENPK